MKRFDDRTITVTDALGTFRATITGDAFEVLLSEGLGPRDEDGLIEANLKIIEQVSSWKREADEGEADGSVRITGLDLEDREPCATAPARATSPRHSTPTSPPTGWPNGRRATTSTSASFVPAVRPGWCAETIAAWGSTECSGMSSAAKDYGP